MNEEMFDRAFNRPTVTEVETLVEAARDVWQTGFHWPCESHWEVPDRHMQNLADALVAFENDSSE